MTIRTSALLLMLAAVGATPAAAQTTTPSSTSCGERTAPSLGSVFTDTVRDLRRVPSVDTMRLLSIGGAAAAAARIADTDVSRQLSSSSSLHETLESGAVLGGTPFQLGAAFTTYAIARLAHRPCAAIIGSDLIRAQFIAETFTLGIKSAVRRSRPEGTGFSFPSGHTTASFAAATVLQQHYGWKIGIPAYAAASYVAASRVQMKRHYLSDVAFGAALGIVVGRTVTFGSARQFSLQPMAAPGGAGVSVTWIKP